MTNAELCSAGGAVLDVITLVLAAASLDRTTELDRVPTQWLPAVSRLDDAHRMAGQPLPQATDKTPGVRVPLPPSHPSSRDKDIRTLISGLLALLLSGSAAGHKIGNHPMPAASANVGNDPIRTFQRFYEVARCGPVLHRSAGDGYVRSSGRSRAGALRRCRAMRRFNRRAVDRSRASLASAPGRPLQSRGWRRIHGRWFYDIRKHDKRDSTGSPRPDRSRWCHR